MNGKSKRLNRSKETGAAAESAGAKKRRSVRPGVAALNEVGADGCAVIA